MQPTDPNKMPVAVPLFRSLFLITDPGRDQDDEDVLVALNRMIRLNILEMLGLVANLAPALQRARLAKGTLSLLGHGDIPVGIGTSCNQPDDDGLNYQFSVGYLAPQAELQDGAELIRKTLEAARPKSIVLLLISGLTDAAEVLRKHSFLFTKAVRRVVIMGGVKVKVVDGQSLPELDEDGRMQPDMTAQNHSFDKDATAWFYQQLQDIDIPLTVLTRHASVAAKVPRDIYDEMAGTGHPIGMRLLEAQKKAIEELFSRACRPADDPKRLGLPARCDKTWFCNTFCAGSGMERGPEEGIWDCIQTFNLYDPCTLIASIPNLRNHFFSSSIVEYRGVEHMVIGLSAAEHNVRNPEELSGFLKTMLVESLKMSLQMDRCA